MKKIQLSIPEPCHENWDSMAPTEQGRYCNACAKEVIDFSNMSDSDVLNYFLRKKKDEKVCGRAYPDQLDRDIMALPQKSWHWQWNYAAMFLFFFFKQDKAGAQGVLKKRMPPATEQSAVKMPKMSGMMLHSPNFVSGTVNNSKGEQVTFDSVRIMHSMNAAKTDENGHFYLKADSAETIIEISSIGYKPAQATIQKTTSKEIVMQENEQLLKEVVVASPHYLRGRVGGMLMCRVSRRKVIADTVKSWVSNLKSPLKIYPNPVQRGSAFTISLKLKQTGTYTIQIADALGRVITARKINAISKEWNEKIESSSNWAAGTYYVKVMDEKGRLFKSAGIAVQ